MRVRDTDRDRVRSCFVTPRRPIVRRDKGRSYPAFSRRRKHGARRGYGVWYRRMAL